MRINKKDQAEMKDPHHTVSRELFTWHRECLLPAADRPMV
jgi:hypothetical protein